MIQDRKYNPYTEEDWRELANLARQQSTLSGFYNDNYRLVHEREALLFRFPKKDEKLMDPRPFYEGDVYKLLRGANLSVPNLIHEAEDRSFQVYEFIDGSLVDEIYPPGQKLPEKHGKQMAEFYANLAKLDIDISPYLSTDWPKQGLSLTFFEKLLETAWLIYKNHHETHGNIYQFLQIPDDPFSPFLEQAGELHTRPWRLMHADIHRANIIEKEDGEIYIIDWELALYGDLLYCIAAHLHRGRFFPDEKEQIATAIYQQLPADFQKNFMKDLSFYLDYEALKSVLTDTVRFPDLLKRGKASNTMMHELSVYYSDNLNRISGLLNTRKTKPEQALLWFEEWSI